MSVETNKQVVLAFLAVYNAHDWERFGNFLAEDIIFQIPSRTSTWHLHVSSRRRSETEAILERIPPFARQIARQTIETRAREKGCSEVTHEIVQEIAQSLGMGGPSNPSLNDK